MTDPGDKVLEVVLVLYDRADGVMVPVEGEAVVPRVVAGKSLDKVQSKHRWYATKTQKKKTLIPSATDSVNSAAPTVEATGVTLEGEGEDTSYLSRVMVLLWWLLEHLLHGAR